MFRGLGVAGLRMQRKARILKFCGLGCRIRNLGWLLSCCVEGFRLGLRGFQASA